MRHANEQLADAPGQDSFLDIVANMVGIMILLVMVMGVRASREAAGVSEAPLPVVAGVAATPVSDEELRRAYRHALDIQKDVQDLVQRTVDVHAEAKLRQDERNFLATYVAAFEQELNERRAQLDVEQQRDYDLRRRLVEAQYTLDNLTREQVSLLAQPDEVEEIEHLPTPLAQTVSGREVHLRLANGHVAYIPLDDLLAELKQHAESNLWQLRDRDSVVSTIGPVGGFRLRYQLRKSQFRVRNDRIVETRGTWVQLSKWELLPESSRLGEPVDQAMLPRSDLWYSLKRHAPESTVVTIWTYPESFHEFRRLKQELYSAGYATAGRPLPAGVMIGGSPGGTKSAAQ